MGHRPDSEMATLITVYDQQETRFIRVKEFEDDPTPEDVGTAVASFRLIYPDEERFEIEILDGPDIKGIREHFGIDRVPGVQTD